MFKIRSRRSIAPASDKDFGLLAWLEDTRIRLPLKGIECRFDTCGEVASVEIEQVFHQANSKPLNCTYTFPLPGNAAVYRCEIQVGKRIIRAKVEEREKAKALFDERVAAGHRAGLVEVERENLFTLSLGNLQPDDLVIVRLAFFQQLDRSGEELSVLIPFCPGVRYIPGHPLLRSSQAQGTVADTDEVPDASRVTPPRMTASNEGAAYVNIEGRLSGFFDPDSLSAPLHKIITARAGPDAIVIRIDPESAIPDRDFVLRWRELPSQEPQAKAWVWRDLTEACALVQLKAPDVAPESDDYEQDHYFLIDRSGSMAGEKWRKTQEAVQTFVGLLGPKDRAWITLYNDTFQDAAGKPLLREELLKTKGYALMSEMGAGGGTMLLPALEHVLGKVRKFSLASNRRANLILVTDGEVGNESAIVGALKPYPELPVFPFGIDTTVNDAFLRQMARQQKGHASFQTPADDIVRAVRVFGSHLRKPVVTEVRAENGWESPDSGIPHLHAGDVRVISLRRNGSDEQPLELSGRLPEGGSYRFAVQPMASANIAVRLLWVRHRITWLLDQQRQGEAIALAVANHLLCPGTAFIAWDDAEQVPVAGQQLYQPSLEPLSMQTLRHRGSPGKVCFLCSQPRVIHEHLMAPTAKQTMAKETLMSAPDLLPIFETPAGREFRRELNNWVEAEMDDKDRRRRAFKKLWTDLLREGEDLERCRALCVAFLESWPPSRLFEDRVKALCNELLGTGGEPMRCEKICMIFLAEIQAQHRRLEAFNRLRELAARL